MRGEILSRDKGILTLNVDGEALEEEMECEFEECGPSHTQDTPAKGNVKNTSQHLSSAEADEGRLHTFVMDYCLPSQGSQRGITVLAIKETKTKAISTLMVPKKKVPANTLSKPWWTS